MKIESGILLFIIAILSLSCKNNESVKEPNSKLYGCNLGNDSIVLLRISNFMNFQELYDEVEQISCSGAVAGVELENDGVSSILTFSNPCWENYGCILIRRRNVFEVIDDSINFEKTYPIDSLNSLLKKHYENQGMLPYYSDHPDKVIVSIKYETNKLEKLPSLLNKLIVAYERIENSKCLNVWFDGKPPPPPPNMNK